MPLVRSDFNLRRVQECGEAGMRVNARNCSVLRLGSRNPLTLLSANVEACKTKQLRVHLELLADTLLLQ
jgi:hypothetical protein